MTQGAGQGVPISGVPYPDLPGQVTCSASVSTGAAKSEPHGTLSPLSACRVHRCGYSGWCRMVRGCTRGAGVQGQDQVRAPHRVRRVHIRVIMAVRPGQAGAGPVRGQGQEQCQEQCQNRAITDTRHPPPDIRHPTSVTSTRHPSPVMYPRYIVTQCCP